MESAQEQIVEEYWQSFLRTISQEGEELPDKYQAWGFGNTPEMADELGDLVRRGIKTATAALVWSFEEDLEPYPEVGEYSVILDGQGHPMCIIQSTELVEVPFDEVDEEQAYLDGEGDRSLAYWREVHWKFFSEECRKIDKEPDEQMLVMCEKFRLVFK